MEMVITSSDYYYKVLGIHTNGTSSIIRILV